MFYSTLDLLPSLSRGRALNPPSIWTAKTRPQSLQRFQPWIISTSRMVDQFFPYPQIL